jgi:formylglycine-generating enzyme required for sulfatase activity
VSHECAIRGRSFASGTANPTNSCQKCAADVAISDWTNVDDGTPCGTGGICHTGACAVGCEIGGVFYDPKAVDASEPCKTCQPAKSTAAWSDLEDGTGCGNGQVCNGGVCGTQCDIGDAGIVASGATTHGGCEVCKPGTSTNAWTHAPDGTNCGSGQICSAGACTDGCYVGGTAVAPDAVAKGGCEVCKPSVDTLAWTNAADGTGCGSGEVCSAGTCGAGCFIAGTLYAAAAMDSTGCGTCAPPTSTTAWTPVDDGTTCGAGEVCTAGSCTPGCFIGGKVYSPGATANSGCEVCDPTASTTTWSNADDGTACATGKVCGSGACQSACFIGGSLYASGATTNGGCESCKPSSSTTAWSRTANGTSCGSGNICIAGACGPGCTIGGTAYSASATTNEGCEVCTPASSTTAWTKLADGSGCPLGSGVCSSGGCVKDASCSGGFAGRTDCGVANENCCTSPSVPGGTFYRTYTNTGSGPTGEADPATVSSFRLDKYLVTVGRFRQFAAAVSAGYLPPSGSGKHIHVNGGSGLVNSAPPAPYEPGWDAVDWNPNVEPTDANLQCYPAYQTWTTSVAGNENYPINCVNWWEAYAFCIWDGGFLPTDAEWEYAAAGGGGTNGQREFPWGTADPGTASQYAIYGCYYGGGGGTCTGIANIAPVGLLPAGGGAYGQLDLAGDMYQWTLDVYATPYTSCTDCTHLGTADLTNAAASRIMRGAGYNYDSARLPSVHKGYIGPDARYTWLGFRCARGP